MLKSVESNIRAFVKFTNASKRTLEVHWINFLGEEVHYTNLNPGGNCMINTFCTHPWIFTCVKTGERLQVNHKNAFLAEAWYKFVIKAENGSVSVGRQEAIIHFPLKSLRDACLWQIVHLVRSKDDIHRLEVPNTLKADLLYVCEKTIRFSSNSDGRNFNNFVDESL